MRNKIKLFSLLFVLVILFSACQPTASTVAPLRSPQPATPILPAASPTVPHPTPIPPTLSAAPTAPARTAAPARPTQGAESAYKGIVLAKIWLYADGSGWGTDLQQTKVLHTFDGGKTWRDLSPALGRGNNQFFFLDGKTAWISQNISEANSYIWHTTDGGVKWLRFSQDTPGGPLSFSSTLNGYMLVTLDAGMSQQSVEIRQTADGGATWVVRWKHLPDEVDPSLPVSGNKTGMLGLSENILLVTGTWPVPKSLYAYRSENGGFSWNQISCEGLPDLGGGDMWDAQQVLRAGNTLILPVRAFASVGVDKTFFCGSTDQGATWNFLSELDATVLHAFERSGAGYSAGVNTVHKTEDGAKTWQELDFEVPAGMGVIDLAVADAQHAYLLLSSLQSGPYAPAFLYASEDGGKTWALVEGEVVQ